jgi:site-specific DNA recombinase
VRNNNHQTSETSPAWLRCAIYTRKSTEEGLEQEFNSLDAQREAAQAFILSQRREGWIALSDLYDDGGFTGANMDRPALTKLLHAVEAGELDCVVVYNREGHEQPIPAKPRAYAILWRLLFAQLPSD